MTASLLFFLSSTWGVLVPFHFPSWEMKVLKNIKKTKKKVENPKTQFRPSVSTDLVQNRTLVRPYPLLVMEFNVHPGARGVLV